MSVEDLKNFGKAVAENPEYQKKCIEIGNKKNPGGRPAKFRKKVTTMAEKQKKLLLIKRS